MTTITETPAKQEDSAWKDVLDIYFKEFMLFFYPELAAEIDWQAGYEVLDKELQAITTDAEIGKRLVDKLVRVKSRRGDAYLVLIHVEIQGDQEPTFELRLFEYYYRLYDRYRLPILTIAVLTDTSRTWRPQRYIAKVWDAEILTFRFLSVKLLDFAERKMELETTKNPFGIILLAHLIASKKYPLEKRYHYKFALTRQLYERGLSRNEILTLYKFIDWVITLPKDLAIRYNEAIHELEKERTMPYITTAERIGMEKGFEQGMQQGMEQGMQQGEHKMLLLQLEFKFKHVPEKYRQLLAEADGEKLLYWSKRVLEATTLEEIFA